MYYSNKGKEGIGRLAGKGKRLIIIQAFTKDEPLVDRDPQTQFRMPEGRFGGGRTEPEKEESKTAEGVGKPR